MLKYSPLCDTSLEAYFAYLLANTRDAGRHEYLVSVFGGEGGRKFDRRRIDLGGNVDIMDSGSSGAVEDYALAGLFNNFAEVGDDGFDGCGVGNAGGRVAGVEGLAGDIFGGGGVTPVDSGRDGVFQHAVAEEVLGAKPVSVKSKNARKRANKRARRAAAKVEAAGVSCDRKVGAADVGVRGDSKGYSFRDVTTAEEQKEFARSWFECKLAENKLHKQRADYNFKHNDYMRSSRIAEKKWECDRLRCEEKLANINRIRFGSKPGYAETLASLSDGSEKPPSLSTGSESPASLSDGTISPNSSMSVAEEYKLKKKLEEMSEEVAQLRLERAALTTSRACSGGKVVVEDGRIHVYDGTGQYVPPTPVYGSECALSMGDYPEELQRHCDFVY